MCPRVSIIIPVFNSKQHLPCCIDSVLGQSFSNFELLLVDDGSTDGSGAVCDSYTEKDNRLRVFHKENGGVSSARNLGMDNAKGEWFSFVDADDEMLPGGLQVLMDGISGDVDMVMAGYEKYNEEGGKIYSVEARVSKIVDSKQAVKEMFAPSFYWYQGFVWDKLIRSKLIFEKHIRFAEDVVYNEDRLFLTQCICESKKSVFFTTAPVYKYYERQGSAMMSLGNGFNSKFITDFEAQIRIRNFVRSRFVDDGLLSLADYEVYKSYRRIVGMIGGGKNNCKQIVPLRIQLVNSIGIWTYYRLEIQRNKRRILNKIKKMCPLCKNS